MTRIPGGYADYSGHPSGGNEFDYPDVVNYHPGNNYSVQDVHMAGDRNRYIIYKFWVKGKIRSCVFSYIRMMGYFRLG